MNILNYSKPMDCLPFYLRQEARATLEVGRNLGLVFYGDKEAFLDHLTNQILVDFSFIKTRFKGHYHCFLHGGGLNLDVEIALYGGAFLFF